MAVEQHLVKLLFLRIQARTLQNAFALLTSSASLAMKKPTVLATIFTPLGFIMILVSLAGINCVSYIVT